MSQETQARAPIGLRQVLGCVVFFGTCLAGTLGKAGWGGHFELGFFTWLGITAGGCAIGGAMMAWFEHSFGFGSGLWIGMIDFLLLQGYVWLRGADSPVELPAVASILSGIFTL